MNYSLTNTASVINTNSAQKTNTAVTASSKKNVFIGKYNQTITIHHTKEMGAEPWKKAACFEIPWTSGLYELELNGLDHVTAFISNELGIDMSAAFQ